VQRRALATLASSALVLVLLTDSCGWAARRDVLLITVDTLRADRVGLYGYARDTTPHIDRWFANAAIYLRAYSTGASTAPSVASILTGRLPQEHRVRLFYQLLPEDVPTLPELLPPGTVSAAFVSNVVLTDEAMGLASRFDYFVDERESVRKIFERRAERTTDAVLAWLAQGEARGHPLFLWVHYIDPHGPYRAPHPWRRHFTSEVPKTIPIDRVPFYARMPGLDDGNAYVALYDSEIAYVDSEIGRLLEGFDRARGIDGALVILTSDHGESMMEHEVWFGHGHHVFEEVVRVPLLVRGPGAEAGRLDVAVSGVDIAGTVAAFTGAKLPPGVAATDLRRPSTLDGQRVVFSESLGLGRQWRAAVQGERKAMIRALKERVMDSPVAFDLVRDSGELRPQPLKADDPLIQLLREKIESDPDPAGLPRYHRAGVQIQAPKVSPRASEADLERLRRLGYVE
jgi:arylsulfatase A-like enzyme